MVIGMTPGRGNVKDDTVVQCWDQVTLSLNPSSATTSL